MRHGCNLLSSISNGKHMRCSDRLLETYTSALSQFSTVATAFPCHTHQGDATLIHAPTQAAHTFPSSPFFTHPPSSSLSSLSRFFFLENEFGLVCPFFFVNSSCGRRDGKIISYEHPMIIVTDLTFFPLRRQSDKYNPFAAHTFLHYLTY